MAVYTGFLPLALRTDFNLMFKSKVWPLFSLESFPSLLNLSTFLVCIVLKFCYFIFGLKFGNRQPFLFHPLHGPCSPPVSSKQSGYSTIWSRDFLRTANRVNLFIEEVEFSYRINHLNKSVPEPTLENKLS